MEVSAHSFFNKTWKNCLFDSGVGDNKQSKMKKLFIILLFPVITQAQTVNLGGGIHNTNPMFQIEAGYQNKLVVMGSYQAIPVREAKSINFYYGVKTGYEIKNFAPTIGYFFSHNGFSGLAYFLKYSVKISNGAVYIEAGRLEKNQITTGFQIDLK